MIGIGIEIAIAIAIAIAINIGIVGLDQGACMIWLGERTRRQTADGGTNDMHIMGGAKAQCVVCCAVEHLVPWDVRDGPVHQNGGQYPELQVPVEGE